MNGPVSRTVGYVTALKSLRDLTKPVIAAVQGHCLGAGLELALCSDIRILAKDARLGVPFVNIRYAGALQAGIATEVVEPPEDLEGFLQNIVAWRCLFE